MAKSLSLTNTCATVVVVTRRVVGGSTLVFLRCFVFRMYYHRAESVSRLIVDVNVV